MSTELVFNKYYVSGKTDCGIARPHNEDSILVNSDAGIILLADGMGGHRFGDRASAESVKLIDTLIQNYLPIRQSNPHFSDIWRQILHLFNLINNAPVEQELENHNQIISDILIETNKAIYLLNQQDQIIDGSGMGTTIVGCKLRNDVAKMHIFHVGDSRLYRFRNNRLEQLTKDHSLYQEWLDNGQIGEKPRSNLIYQGIGPKPTIDPSLQIIDIEPQDCFLLCSDGLTDLVEDDLIAEIIKNSSKNNIEIKIQTLINNANINGGLDNISVIMICQ